MSTKVLAAILGVALARYGPDILRAIRQPVGSVGSNPERAAAWARNWPPDRTRPPTREEQLIALARRVGAWWGRRHLAAPAAGSSTSNGSSVDSKR